MSMKWVLVPCVLGIVAGCAHHPVVKEGALPKGHVVAETQAEPVPHSITTVFAVLDYENQTGQLTSDHLVRALSDLVSTRLSSQPGFKVVERQRLQDVMKELQLTTTGAIDLATALRIGKLIGANILLMGSLTQLGNDLLMSTRMVRVDTGEVIGGFTQKGHRETDLDEMSARTADQVADIVHKSAKH